MKILWVKSGGLIPLDTGGKIRSFNLLKQLAQKHETTLFTFYSAYEDDTHNKLNESFSRVVNLPVTLPKQRGFAEAMKYMWNLASAQPYSLTKYTFPGVANSLLRLLEEGLYDVVICDFLFSAPIVPWNYPVPKILFTHNVETQIWKRHFEIARNPIWKAVTWREYRTMQKAEHRYLEQADHVLTVSEYDKQIFSRFLPPERITVIPTGVDIEYFHPVTSPVQAGRLVFTGSMDWMPNEDAIIFFVEEVFPRIREKVPAATFYVAGRRPSGRLRALATPGSGVHVTGALEDIRPNVWDAAVYVVPLRVGGGTRIKIFEAMAMGKAIVSTSVGAEGLPVEHGQNILLEDSADHFALAVVKLLQDAGELERLGKAARTLVEQNFSWTAVASSFEGVFEKIVKTGDRSPKPAFTPDSAMQVSAKRQ